MNKLRVFKNPEFGELGVLVIDGKEYFPATDCARALGYSNPHKAIGDHCKGVTKREVLTGGGTQEVNFIPEGDLYRLIIRSNLPAAEKFERWVFDEVLPSIRRTGFYAIPAIPAVPTTPAIPAAAQAYLSMSEEDRAIAYFKQQKKIKEDKPKLDKYDLFLQAPGAQEMHVVAKTLGIAGGRNKLFKLLREKKILMQNNVPYQKYKNTGYFEVIQRTVPVGKNGATMNVPQTLVTAKGVDFIADILMIKRQMDLGLELEKGLEPFYKQ